MKPGFFLKTRFLLKNSANNLRTTPRHAPIGLVRAKQAEINPIGHDLRPFRHDLTGLVRAKQAEINPIGHNLRPFRLLRPYVYKLFGWRVKESPFLLLSPSSPLSLFNFF
jgi:hypothetical protein